MKTKRLVVEGNEYVIRTLPGNVGLELEFMCIGENGKANLSLGPKMIEKKLLASIINDEGKPRYSSADAMWADIDAPTTTALSTAIDEFNKPGKSEDVTSSS